MEKTVVFGNYLFGGCVCIEDDLTLQKIHGIVNNWGKHPITGELYRFYNETQMMILDDGLIVFNHTPKKFSEDDISAIIPCLIVDGHSIFGNYLITRYEDGKFVNLRQEDIIRLEKCQCEIEEMRMKEIEKRRVERKNK